MGMPPVDPASADKHAPVEPATARRPYLIPLLGSGIPPENFDFRGMSGGPMLGVVESTLRSWALVGVIYQGPNTSLDPNEAIPGLEIIRARRAHFILPDGQLNRDFWAFLAI
jgi:hypothetical protein